MIDEIKQRIEQIKAGRTPEGYRRTKAGIMPDDWELKEASEYFYNYSNKTHNGQGEVLSVTQDKGVIPRNQIEIDIKYNQDSLDTYKYVESGDFIISLRSFQGGIEYSEYNGLVSPAYTVLKNKVELNKGFYKHYFKTQDFIKRLNKATYGIRDGKQIGYDDFASLELHFPSLPEQNRINEILSTWDKVIKLKERLIEEKKRRKKWLIQKLLNPESGVRLPGFTGEWKTVKIRNISEINPKSLSENTSPEYEFTYIDLSSTGEPEQIDFSRKILFKNAPSRARRIFEKNDILLSMVRPYLQNFIFVDFEPKDFICSTGFAVIHCEQNVSSKYVFYTMFSESISRQIKKILVGTNYPAINAEDVKNLLIPLPPLSEQIAIADILFTADKEIALLKKELEETKLQKKALMQLLLTGIVRVK